VDRGELGSVVSIARDSAAQIYLSDAGRHVVQAYRLQILDAATPTNGVPVDS
jgi:hypothetical protein